MKNHVGKNIVKLRKEQGLSQEQLAGKIHVTRQAVSNWETGRSQPDLDMLEALAGAFNTDILMVIYGEIPPKEDMEIKAAGKKRHLRLAILFGLASLAACILISRISLDLDELRKRTYNNLPYAMFRTFVFPVAGTFMGITLMHILNLIGTIRISDPGSRKKALMLGILLVPIYIFLSLWAYGLLPVTACLPVWVWRLSASMFPQVLFFFIGLLVFLGIEP